MSMRATLLACSTALVLVAAAPARAQQIVEDPANLAQNVLQAARAVEQIRNQVRQIEAATSHSGFGVLADGAVERAARRYAPPSWEEALRVLEAGGLPGDAGDLGATLEALRSRYGVLDRGEIEALRAPGVMKDAFARSQATGLLAESLSSAAFAQIGARIDGIESMLGAIETAPDIKAAQDLNARISGELALVQVEVLRLQAARDALDAQEANRRVAAQSQMQRFLAVRPAEAALTGAGPLLEPRD